MTDYIVVITTSNDKETAEKIAREVLEKRLGACVQISGPIISWYWWKGEINQAEEYRCVIKSRSDLYSRLEETIRKNHPYDVPEILAMPVSAGSKRYLQWLTDELEVCIL